MIILTIEMDVPTDKIKELLQTLMAVTERIQKETGCIGCDILKIVGGENRYRIMGRWRRQDDLNNHLQSNEARVLLGAMSLLENQPEIRLDVVYSSKGLESLHKSSGELKRSYARR